MRSAKALVSGSDNGPVPVYVSVHGLELVERSPPKSLGQFRLRSTPMAVWGSEEKSFDTLGQGPGKGLRFFLQ